jgi:phage-related protein
VKEVRWLGDARSVVREFSKSTRRKLGQELTRVQLGANPKHGKSLPQVGRGVQEIRIADNKEAYRVILCGLNRHSDLRTACLSQEIETRH